MTLRHLIRKLYPVTPAEAAQVLNHQPRRMFSAKVIAKANEMRTRRGMPPIIRNT